MGLHPRHRGDCADLFAAPNCTEQIELRIPLTVRSTIEQEAERTDRSWNEQFLYVSNLCTGKHPPDFDDVHSVEDWRTLLSSCAFRFAQTDEWDPFPCLWRGRDHEHKTIS